MSGYYNNYEARPADVKRATDEIGALAEAPKEARARFDSTEQAVYGWNGHDDDFFQQSNPQYLAQNESCRAVLDGLGQFLTGLQAATMESLRSIGQTQAAVQDSIDDAKLNAENYRNGGNGKR